MTCVLRLFTPVGSFGLDINYITEILGGECLVNLTNENHFVTLCEFLQSIATYVTEEL